MNATQIISLLALEPHVEGGFYKRTYEASHQPRVTTPHGDRLSMTSIYYLLTSESPTGYFHKNKADIVHYFHSGAALEYFLISPQGELFTTILGDDLSQRQQFQLTVPGGWWKASQLKTSEKYDYGLISEAVSPGFDYADMSLGKPIELVALFPQHKPLILQLTR
ncbi:hypothetical protein P886_4868 [Alteromonadaceae bacterium 2753L.S.0a.02]|nr:hypothetical protein P886_4868 [Alteromonadaceae bacterium 2753L.S.0a.02]